MVKDGGECTERGLPFCQTRKKISQKQNVGKENLGKIVSPKKVSKKKLIE